MQFKAVLFDMDGVIVDTEPLHRKSYFEMFERFGIDVSEELYNTFTGKTTIEVCSELIDHYELNIEVSEMMAEKRKYFKYLFDHDSEFGLIPGVRSLIENYHAHHIKMVLASSASMQTIQWVFEKFDLNPYFVGKISGADLQASKPHPEIFLRAAEIAAEPTDNCMVIEDSTNGIMAAHAANIFCVGYKSPHSKDQDYSLAQMVISDFNDIHIERNWVKYS